MSASHTPSTAPASCGGYTRTPGTARPACGDCPAASESHCADIAGIAADPFSGRGQKPLLPRQLAL